MPYLILFVLTVSGAVIAAVSADAASVLCLLTAFPMAYIAFRPLVTRKPISRNIAFWLMTFAATFFSTSATDNSIHDGQPGVATFMAVCSVFWLVRGAIVAHKMHSLDDETYDYM